MSTANFPKGAGLGRDPNPQRPTLIDFNRTMQHDILRQSGATPEADFRAHELRAAREVNS